MILDTSFLVELLRGDEPVDATFSTIDASGPARVPSVVVMELWEGIHLADTSDQERDAVEELLQGLHEVPFGRECAMVAGEVTAKLSAAGTPIETADVQIAATALVHDEPVVTGNADHFERIDGLEVVTY